MKNSVLILGGDLRLLYAADALRKAGFKIESCVYTESFTNLYDKIKKADILLLPPPVSSDGESLNAPFCIEKILLSDIEKAAGSEKIIIGGKIPEGVFSGRVIDYIEREDFAILNAVPTAEGALEIAMRESEITISGSKTLVVGFGRIGKMLCKMFSGVGAKVCATARKPEDIALINAMGYDSLKTCDVHKTISDYDIIINTVPCEVIGYKAISRIKMGAVLIDTASKPGGVDMTAANEFGVKVIWALSLPGKVAPKTAGKIICDTVLNIISETGV